MSQAVTVPPAQAQSLLREGVTAAQSGNPARARALIRQVAAAEPENETAWMWLANLSGDARETVECVRKVLAINPTNAKAQAALPVALTRAAIALAQQNDKPAARAYLKEATALDPKSETAWMWFAGVAESAEQASHCLRHALAINPANERAKQGLAQYAALRQEWRCPICRYVAPAGRSPCPACRCVLTLADPSAFDGPTGADPARVAAALEQLRGAFAQTTDPTTGYLYALACLNLGKSGAALPVLETVSRHPATDDVTRSQVLTYLKYFQARVAIFTPPPANVPTVMVVEDSPTVRKLVATTLEAAGYRVISLPDGVQVAEAVRQHGVPDLFVLDIVMPGLDGYQLCKRLRGDPATAGVPVVFLTGKASLLSKLRGQWAGAADYLVKPFQPQHLLQVAAALTAKRRP
jgi:CheY-like chemotaxis protein